MVDSGEQLGARVIVVGRRGLLLADSDPGQPATRLLPLASGDPGCAAHAALAGRTSQRHARRGPPVHSRARDEQRRHGRRRARHPEHRGGSHARPQRGSRADRGRGVRALRRPGPGLVHRRLALEAAAELARTARRVEGGDLDAKAEVSGPREQREVAVAFNDMTDRLGVVLAAQRTSSRTRRISSGPVDGLAPSARGREREGGSEAAGELEAAEFEVERLARLLTSLLTLAREGDEPGLPRPVSLARAAEGAEGAGRLVRRGKAARSSCAATGTPRSPPPRRTWRSCSTT